jgi:hypothetical protein
VNAWLSGHVSRFLPVREEAPERLGFRTKAFGELCLYMHLAQKFAIPSLIPDTVKTTLGEFVAGCDFRDALFSNPGRTATLAICVLPFDWRDKFPGLPQYYKTVCRPLNNEMLPFQALCHIYAYDELGLLDAESAHIEERLVKLSALWNVPNCLSSPREGPYSFTHSAFYATRFGTRALNLSETQKQAIANYIDTELCKAFSLRDMDAALEIVVAGICLRGHVSEKEIIVIESTITLLEEKGYLQSAKDESSLFDDAEDQKWEGCYHTMIVAGLMLLKLAAPAPALLFAGGRAEDTRHMESLALAMDAIGTMYGAVESGNLALAVYILSKLGDIPEEIAPTAEMLAPIHAFLAGIVEMAKADPRLDASQSANEKILGTTRAEFEHIVKMYQRLCSAQ